MTDDLLMTFYGDDLTGSTDAMEALALAGLRVALFLVPPQPHHLQGRFANLRAVGIAGASRSMNPAQMEQELRPKFSRLNHLNAPLVHYKVCSTFDSSPYTGSIGRAIDIGQFIFNSPFVPCVVGAPTLRRYVIFANLFATVDGETYRIDRHPTMSRHPVTPMQEGDLRLHLRQQTDRSIASLDVLQLDHPPDTLDSAFTALLAQNPEIILFDTINESHLAQIGRLLWREAMASMGNVSQPGNTGNPLFVVGSSGVEYALVKEWERSGLLTAAGSFPSPGPVEQIIVMSGSCAPPTAKQIDWALANGFGGVRLDSVKLIDAATAEEEKNRAMCAALDILAQGQSVILYSARGPDDPAIAETRSAAQTLRHSLGDTVLEHRLPQEQGNLLRTLLEETGIRRVCIAGGDTCSHTTPRLEIYALEMVTPISPGAPLCRASATWAGADGLEIALKGGQNGNSDYFEQIREGSHR